MKKETIDKVSEEYIKVKGICNQCGNVMSCDVIGGIDVCTAKNCESSDIGYETED